MKKFFALLIGAALLYTGFGRNSNDDTEVFTNAGSVSVTVDDNKGHMGSGVVFKNGDRSFVWTAAHVVGAMRTLGIAINPENGAEEAHIEYGNVYLRQEILEDGQKVQEMWSIATIIKYGEKDDIALLWVHKKDFGVSSVNFLDTPPEAGQPCIHVGSFYGAPGMGSVSAGVIGAVGRIRNRNTGGILFDQYSGVAHPGSSGGGVFLRKTGAPICVGLVDQYLAHVRGVGSAGAMDIIPSRRIREWAATNAVRFALDDGYAVPPLEELLRSVTVDKIVIARETP